MQGKDTPRIGMRTTALKGNRDGVNFFILKKFFSIPAFSSNKKAARMERAGSIQLDIPDFSNSVLSHLNQLRMQGRLCDIVVNVQGQSFRAHKVVLAASSPYFRDHMSLSEMSTVSLSVIRNPSVFEQLLSFCYTGRLCLQLADIISYLTAASFLQMQHIIDRCTQILEGIHFKISLADVEEELAGGQVHRSASRIIEAERGVSTLGGSHSLSPRHGGSRVITTHGGAGGVIDIRDVREVREVSPSGESMSPQVVENSGLAAEATVGSGKEPILRINRAGQWYVETGPDVERGGEEAVRVVEGLRIKTERMEEWIGAETQASAEEGSGAEEGTAMMIDTSGRSTLVQEGFVTGASRAKSSQPSSSFSESERQVSKWLNIYRPVVPNPGYSRTTVLGFFCNTSLIAQLFALIVHVQVWK